jgi:hypothetical protein
MLVNFINFYVNELSWELNQYCCFFKKDPLVIYNYIQLYKLFYNLYTEQ